MIKVAIIEDLIDVGLVLQNLVNEEFDMECKHYYNNAEDAIVFLPRSGIDIAIVDIGLPRANGLEVIRKVSASNPEIQFCMFTVYEDDEKIFESLKTGAKGYILKGTSTEEIINSIRELYNGGAPMSNTIARRLLDIFQGLKLPEKNENLPISERERELLNYLSKGYLYKEIGEMMGITTGTVKQHIHRIYEKLHVSNRTEAIIKYNGNQ